MAVKNYIHNGTDLLCLLTWYDESLLFKVNVYSALSLNV